MAKQSQLLDFALQAGQGAVGAGLGLMLQGGQDRRQLRQQEKLQNLQMKGAMQMWRDTNYPAQIEQLKKAGLNPGLLYGMGGAGGTTTGGVQTGHAPVGGGEIMGMGMTTAQMGLLRAQKENIEAGTAKTKAETTKTTGVDTTKVQTETASLAQGIENQKAQQELTKIETQLKQIEQQVKGKTIHEQQDLIVNAALKGIEEIDILHTQKLLDRAQYTAKVDEYRAKAINEVLKSQLIHAQTQNTQMSTQEAAQRIIQSHAQINKWAIEMSQGWQNLSRQERELKLKAWEAEVKAAFPGIGQVIGRTLNNAIEELFQHGNPGTTIDTHKYQSPESKRK